MKNVKRTLNADFPIKHRKTAKTDISKKAVIQSLSKQLVILFFCFSCTLIAAEQDTFTTSVIIPCHYTHAQYLESLLHELSEQTSLPDEVVISISEASKVETGLVNELKSHCWPFELLVLQTNQKKHPGENRNIAAENSSSEIFICQDADDHPHPQRIEIIKYIFKTAEIDYLLHCCYWLGANEHLEKHLRAYRQHTFSYGAIIRQILPKPMFYPDKKFLRLVLDFLQETRFKGMIQKIPGLGRRYGPHFGQCAFKREVFDTIKWSNLRKAEDVEFCEKVCNNFANKYVVNVPLVFYAPVRSTLRYPLSK